METLDYCIQNSSKISSEREELASYTRAHINGSHMLIGELEGTFFQYLIAATQVKTILELGTYTGYSALTMAEALPDDGKIISLDINEKTNQIAKDFIQKSPQAHKIELKLVSALDFMQECLSNSTTFDLIFIDADKGNYPQYVELAKKLLSATGSIVVDNVLWHAKAANEEIQDRQTKAIRESCRILKDDSSYYTVMLPIRDGILISTKSK